MNENKFVNPENLKTYVFTAGDISFTCRANNQEEANKFFDQAHLFSGTRKISSTDPDVVCEEK